MQTVYGFLLKQDAINTGKEPPSTFALPGSSAFAGFLLPVMIFAGDSLCRVLSG
jgi:hypothetical protein